MSRAPSSIQIFKRLILKKDQSVCRDLFFRGSDAKKIIWNRRGVPLSLTVQCGSENAALSSRRINKCWGACRGSTRVEMGVFLSTGGFGLELFLCFYLFKSLHVAIFDL